MLKKLRRKVYRKIRFQTWYRKAYYYHRKRRDLDKTIAQYRGVDTAAPAEEEPAEAEDEVAEEAAPAEDTAE